MVKHIHRLVMLPPSHTHVRPVIHYHTLTAHTDTDKQRPQINHLSLGITV